MRLPLAEANPDTRPANQAAALAHLEKSASLEPGSWETRYHLAFQLAELRQISPALDNARKAVELAGPGASRDAWHLLGLLVAAQKDMRKSLQVLETALEEEGDDEDDDGEALSSSRASTAANGTGLLNGLSDRLNNLPPPVGSVASSTRVSTPGSAPGPASRKSPAASASRNFEFFQDQTAQLVSDVQLRMTKNVILEVLEGPEAALLDQQGLLAYFSRAYARVDDVGE